MAWELRGTLPPWATFDKPTGKVTGTPTSAGDVDLTLAATDAGGGGATKAFKVSVAKNIVVTGTKPSYAAVGGGALATDRPTAQYASGSVRWTVASGTLPAWATLNEATGVVSGSPDRPGGATTTLRATDAEGTTGDSDPVSLSVTSGFAVTGPTDQSARVDVQGTTAAPSVAAPAAGGTGPTAPITWSLIGTKPDWATFSASAGTLSGKPTKAGSVSGLVLRATDAKGVQAYTSAFSLAVAPAMRVTSLETAYTSAPGPRCRSSPLPSTASAP